MRSFREFSNEVKARIYGEKEKDEKGKDTGKKLYKDKYLVRGYWVDRTWESFWVRHFGHDSKSVQIKLMQLTYAQEGALASEQGLSVEKILKAHTAGLNSSRPTTPAGLDFSSVHVPLNSRYAQSIIAQAMRPNPSFFEPPTGANTVGYRMVCCCFWPGPLSDIPMKGIEKVSEAIDASPKLNECFGNCSTANNMTEEYQNSCPGITCKVCASSICICSSAALFVVPKVWSMVTWCFTCKDEQAALPEKYKTKSFKTIECKSSVPTTGKKKPWFLNTNPKNRPPSAASSRIKRLTSHDSSNNLNVSHEFLSPTTASETASASSATNQTPSHSLSTTTAAVMQDLKTENPPIQTKTVVMGPPKLTFKKANHHRVFSQTEKGMQAFTFMGAVRRGSGVQINLAPTSPEMNRDETSTTFSSPSGMASPVHS